MMGPSLKTLSQRVDGDGDKNFGAIFSLGLTFLRAVNESGGRYGTKSSKNQAILSVDLAFFSLLSAVNL